MHIRANDAQLAERKLLLCSPLARGDCAHAQSIFMPKIVLERIKNRQKTQIVSNLVQFSG